MARGTMSGLRIRTGCGNRSPKLLDFDLCSRFGQLLPSFFGFFLRYALFDLDRCRLHHALGFFQAKSGDRANSLDG